MIRIASRGTLALALTLTLAPLAQAQMFRAYLASDGLDGNPCTLQAPCRLLPAALAATASGGEVWMLDSANYNGGPVNITKSVTILAVPGALGSVVAAGGNAINIATAGVKVVLRNLVIVPLLGSGGTNGVSMTAGDGLTVENCLFANLTESGINVTGAAGVRITDTTLRDNRYGAVLQNGVRSTITRATISGNSDGGVSVFGSAASVTTVDIADSTLDGGNYGLHAVSMVPGGVLRVSVRDSRLVRNAFAGAQTQSNTGSSVTLSVSSSVVSNNGTGIMSSAAGSKVWVSGNTVSDNGTGLSNVSGGLLESAGNNAVRNNPTANTSGPIVVIATS